MKVRIKNKPKVGDQVDYSLVDNSGLRNDNLPSGKKGVSNTLSPVDRSEANVEAERGESVLGDVNGDGFLENFAVLGKKHEQGGTPLNIEPGSFVFSDDKKYLIKDPEVLKKFFGVNAPATPGKIAKRFQINEYVDTLKDPEADVISKRTAQMMIDKNLKTLQNLALLQESMKGFEGVVPDFLGSEEPQMMNDGGTVQPKYVQEYIKKYGTGPFLTKEQQEAYKKVSALYLQDLQKELAAAKSSKNPNQDNLRKLQLKYELLSNNADFKLTSQGASNPSAARTIILNSPVSSVEIPNSFLQQGFDPTGASFDNQFITADGNQTTSGKVRTKVSGPGTGNTFTQYGGERIKQILEKDPTAIRTNINFGEFGTQNRIQNTGIYLSSNNAAARKAGVLSADEWEDFENRHGDWIESTYDGGLKQFKEDLTKSPETGKKAAEFFQTAVNQKSKEKFGVEYFGDQGAYAKDGMFGQVTFSVPRFWDKTEEAPAAPTTTTPTTAGGTETVAEEKQPVSREINDLTREPVRRNNDWFLPDIMNFTGAMTDQISRFEPLLSRVDLEEQEYVLNDPTRMLAANQEQMSRMSGQLERTLDPTVAAASLLAASGEGFVNAANVIAATENANVQTVNAVNANNTQIRNNEQLGNIQALQKYVGDMATLNYNIETAENQRKWRRIAAFNKGTDNLFKRKLMETVIFPQFSVDPINSEVFFTGQGKDPNAPDLSPAGSNAMSRDFTTQATQFESLVKDFSAKYGAERGLEMAKALYTTTQKNKANTANNMMEMYTNIFD